MNIENNIIRHYLKNCYFINGTAYAGKSTMCKLLAERCGMLHCEENYNHDVIVSVADPKSQPNTCYFKTMSSWQEFVTRTPDEYEAWIRRTSKECEIIELQMLAQLDAQECTTLSLLPPATEGGRVIAAQNWDFYRQLRDSIVILHVHQENKPNFVMVSEAGMIGGIGMNDRGIGVLLNALTADTTCQGIPLRTRMRAMLDSDTLAEAYAKGSHKPTSVGHLVATHKDGVAIAFEMDSKGFETIIPEDGVWVHTNHYVGRKMYQAHDAAPRASTYIRLQRIQALVKEAHGKITKETVMHMLRDHAGYPYSLCTHENSKDPVTTQYVTNFAIIMDLTEGCFYLAPGNPCESEFEKYDI